MKYKIQATLEQIIAYRPDDPSTHTPSPIVNAVADTLYTTKCIECNEVASHLEVDSVHLSGAILIETGMRLKDIIQQYRLAQYNAFKAAHQEKDYTVDEVAQALGYANGNSIYRFIRTQTGQTLRGHNSVPVTDNYAKVRSELRKAHKRW